MGVVGLAWRLAWGKEGSIVPLMKFGMGLSMRLILIGGGAALVVTAYLFWSSMRSVEALFTENMRLQQALSRLQEEAVVGHLWLLSRSRSEEGVVTTFVWMEPAAAPPHAAARVETLSVSGDTVYLDGFLIRFPGKLVEDGKARALFLWRRAFGDDQAPNAGILLDGGYGAPPRYESIFAGALTAAESRQFWSSLWNLTHNPKALSQLEIETLTGQAVAIQPRPNYLYTVRLSATGALSVVPAVMDPAHLPGTN